MTFNLAHVFERVARAVPDREALVTVQRRLTYSQLDERASRLADHLAREGVRRGDHVGLHLMNGTEYLEGMLAAFKLSAVPININYRYVERELAYLYDNADLVAVVFHRQFGPVVSAVRDEVPALGTYLVVEDDSGAGAPAGAVDYETAIADADPNRSFEGRSGDDLYIVYTGGTTGMPKGVMWRHEDIFLTSLGGGDPTGALGPITDPDEIVDRVLEHPAVSLPTPPFMHVSAHWSAFHAFYSGGKIVVPKPGAFDPDDVWHLIEKERVHIVTLVGDAMVRPFLTALERGGYDASSLFVLASGGAPLSDSAKERARALLPNVIIMDGYGSSEMGVTSTSARVPGVDAGEGASRFVLDDRTAVLDDEHRRVAPGSGVIGHLARCGRLPLGYYKDPEKTAATFVEAEGARWVLSGDFASVDADGSIVLHGRGSVSINTGGEKVFPEEVEKALVGHPAVRDAVVVGVPDPRWGSRVVAVVSCTPGKTLDLDALQSHCRDHLAGYKIPRDLVLVAEVLRNPNGKADYRWAQERALSVLAT
jgi:acyl-CoA synthetase (AMP-forming)/AMP-acid ligase II